MHEVAFEPTLAGWRAAARRMLAERIPPEQIFWREIPGSSTPATPGLFDEPAAPGPPETAASELLVPRAFMALAQDVARSAEPDRWRMLYSVLWRLVSGDRDLLLRRGDPELEKLRRLAAEAEGSAEGSGAPGAASFIPETSDLAVLSAASAACRGCHLYRDATQTVFGRGPASARAVLVGEAPGDQEDLQGAPFVGPAGDVLTRALAEAGLPRNDVYVTNAVKHFKFLRTPKRRLHQTPDRKEIEACKPWLAAELALIRPRVLVCLGATASKALLGPDFRLMKQRGQFLEASWAPKVLATFHPSAVLRAEDESGKDRVYRTLVSDLRLAAGALI